MSKSMKEDIKKTDTDSCTLLVTEEAFEGKKKIALPLLMSDKQALFPSKICLGDIKGACISKAPDVFKLGPDQGEEELMISSLSGSSEELQKMDKDQYLLVTYVVMGSFKQDPNRDAFHHGNNPFVVEHINQKLAETLSTHSQKNMQSFVENLGFANCDMMALAEIQAGHAEYMVSGNHPFTQNVIDGRTENHAWNLSLEKGIKFTDSTPSISSKIELYFSEEMVGKSEFLTKKGSIPSNHYEKDPNDFKDQKEFEKFVLMSNDFKGQPVGNDKSRYLYDLKQWGNLLLKQSPFGDLNDQSVSDKFYLEEFAFIPPPGISLEKYNYLESSIYFGRYIYNDYISCNVSYSMGFTGTIFLNENLALHTPTSSPRSFNGPQWVITEKESVLVPSFDESIKAIMKSFNIDRASNSKIKITMAKYEFGREYYHDYVKYILPQPDSTPITIAAYKYSGGGYYDTPEKTVTMTFGEFKKQYNNPFKEKELIRGRAFFK